MDVICAAAAAISLLSVGHSAPVSSCEGLIQPLDIQSRDQLLGKWTYIAESSDIPRARTLTKMLVESAWANVTAGDESNTLRNYLYQKMFGVCFTYKTDITLSGSSFSSVQPYSGTASLLNTRCPDCLVSYSNITLGNSAYKGLLLMSRRDSVSAAELEDFKKQVECLNLPLPAIMDPQKGFCPDPSVSQESTPIDLTRAVTSDVLTVMDDILKSQNGVQNLLKMVTTGISQLQQNAD